MSRLLNNNKALLFIIAVLLITNIAMVVFFFCTKPGPGKCDDRGFPPREAMSVFLKNEIKFSPEQLKQFDSLKNTHRKAMKPLFRSMNAVKDNFYLHISDETVNDSLLINGLDSIAIRQKMLDRAMFYHFRKVRSLCTPEQLPLYDSLVQRLIKKIMNPYRRPDNHKKDTTGFSGK
jgi:protein CpxP